MEKTASRVARKSHDEQRGLRMTAAVVPYTNVREGIADACRRAWGNYKSAAKEIARAIDCSPRTAENFLAARNAPNAEGLVALMRESDEVFYTVMHLAGRLPEAERMAKLQRVELMLQEFGEAAE